MNSETYIKLHSLYEKKAYTILRKYIKKIVNNIPLDNVNVNNAEAIVLLNFDKDAINKAYVEMYTSIGIAHGKYVLRDIENQIKEMGFFETFFRETLLNWMGINVGNRIISVNETLAKTIIDIIKGSFDNELNIVQIRNLIQKRLNLANFYKWQAMRIVRTETTTISNYAAFKASENSNLVLDKEWVSIQDDRTRRLPKNDFDHLKMNGVIVERDAEFFVNGDLLLFPGDAKSVFPENIINCYLPDNFIESNIIEGQKSLYSGKAFKIVTRRGESLTVTPNHSILTKYGFVKAKDLKIGDYLICNKVSKYRIVRLVNNYVKKKLFRVQNVFSTLNKLWLSKKIMITALDFDGDGESLDSYVDIIYPKTILTDSVKIKVLKFVDKFKFKFPNSGSIDKSGFSTFDFFSSAYKSTNSFLVSFLYLTFPLAFSHFRPLTNLSLGLCSKLNAIRFKSKGNDVSTDVKFLRELIDTDSKIISFDDVIDIEIFDYTGHVYDFTSYNGVNIVNNIYTSNCRCTFNLVPRRDANGMLIRKVK